MEQDQDFYLYQRQLKQQDSSVNNLHNHQRSYSQSNYGLQDNNNVNASSQHNLMQDKSLGNIDIQGINKYHGSRVSRNIQEIKQDLNSALNIKELKGESRINSFMMTPIFSPQDKNENDYNFENLSSYQYIESQNTGRLESSNTGRELLQQKIKDQKVTQNRKHYDQEEIQDYQRRQQNINLNRSNISQRSLQESNYNQRPKSVDRYNSQRQQHLNDSVDQILVDIEKEYIRSKQVSKMKEQQIIEEDIQQRKELFDSIQQNVELQNIQNVMTNENLKYENTLLKQEIDSLNVQWNKDRLVLQQIESDFNKKQQELSNNFDKLQEQYNALLIKEKKQDETIESLNEELEKKDLKIQDLKQKIIQLENQTKQIQFQYQEKNGFIQSQESKIYEYVQMKQFIDKLKQKLKDKKGKYKKELEKIKESIQKQKINYSEELKNLHQQNEQKSSQLEKLEQQLNQKDKTLQKLDSLSYKQLKEILIELNSSHIKEALEKLKEMKNSQKQTQDMQKFVTKFTNLYQQVTGAINLSLKNQ